MNFRKKILRALDYDKDLNLDEDVPVFNFHNHKINSGALNLKYNQEEEYVDLLKPPKTNSNQFFPYFNFLVSENNKKFCSFTIYGFTLLSKISFLNVNYISCYNIDDVIYMDCCDLKNVNEIKKMFSSVKLFFRDWNVDLYTVLGNKRKEILFFNGSKFLSLVPRKIIFFEDDLPDYFKHTDLRKDSNKCKICKMNEYKFIIEDNPVIPENYRKVCEDCLKIIEKNGTH
ncbi:hypothetical protein NBO_32g0004 [Nosema bombycis CQ1]|uniref:Uncharacterized protein n=1 Tax=Nosema bombycis (strain CQ1 / CVCC 102059) TaxID=578461 RepID=R0M8B7_NOSB1|nr:hypothetical protein NBO_32g0004 [Nosema bombycis CQ1]|eukprot:EOB14229.1 hypothetical protein NBO_32g0004 [Nosema bombycis CQ1]